MRKVLIIVVIFSFSYGAFSDISLNNPIVEGIIVSYNKDTVTLSQRGKKIRVPRKSIPARFKIRSGNKVYAFIKEETVRQKKPRQNKKSVQKQKIKN